MRGYIWSMFFIGVYAFQFHPGVKLRLTVKDCALIADDMLLEYIARFKE